nr:MAG TPA: hypothetical protein [Caudoviricetes sp.]
MYFLKNSYISKSNDLVLLQISKDILNRSLFPSF